MSAGCAPKTGQAKPDKKRKHKRTVKVGSRSFVFNCGKGAGKLGFVAMCGMPRILLRVECSISEPDDRFGSSVDSTQCLSDFAEVLLVIFSNWLDMEDQRSVRNFIFKF